MNRNLIAAFSIFSLIAAVGCTTPPSNLDLSLKHQTAQGKFMVSLQPPETAPDINQIHTWQIKVASAAGVPVHQAKISVDGGMPQHGHGLPTRPQVTRELDDGTYLLEGMKFSMTGWWEIKLAITAPEGSDKVTFNTMVLPSSASR
jgi:YtkA-like